ncbi:isoflavone reductase family protein [Cordyceps militaris CM01]|uniref:Isoflavone reductase family protein n=1 Tax=Cordyceps militaris (strain CM01) TaxID=983644 RepID=G3JLZ9_CORMM|nr:isoflavone reductase family protein [Cordyceps militaris CM01]EGX90723.1 isoflavone reductase family protein [Cordyceps militaris CM01]
MSTSRVVAVAGASGNLGAKITEMLLQPPFRQRFAQVVILARSSSTEVKRLASLGAVVRQYSDDNLEDALKHVDVLINTIGPAGHKFKAKLLQSLPNSSVKLYFPSEFGVNHYVHDFEHEEWDAKKAHMRMVREMDLKVQVCRVFAGLFLEDSIGPWFGFFTRESSYQAIGDATQRTSYTSMYDVGRALAILASSEYSEIPSEVQLSGDNKSMTEIARIMEESGADPIKITSLPLEPYRKEVMAKPTPTPERYLRFLMGQGKIDHSAEGMGNHNYLFERDDLRVNWQTCTDLARESRGVPWRDTEWVPTAI